MSGNNRVQVPASLIFICQGFAEDKSMFAAAGLFVNILKLKGERVMKRSCMVLSVILSVFLLTIGCGSDGGKEAGSIMKKQTQVTESYVNGLLKAENADDVVKVVEKYTEGMKGLIPDLQDFHKKYPDYQQGKVPKEMEAEMKRLEEVSAKIPEATMKIASYMMDPKVQQAMMQMGQEMSKIQQ